MNRILILLVLTSCCTAAFGADVVSASLDLRNFEYRFAGSTSVFADYSSLSFLSDDLLVISINQRSFGPVESRNSDVPESTIVVFDVKRANVTITGKMPVEKTWDSVQAISGERFAVLNEEGLQFCDQNLHCEPIAPTIRKSLCVAIGQDKSDFKFHADLRSDAVGPTALEDAGCYRPWKGEVWIDAEDYQPIRIDTQLAKGVPWGVRVFLGIDIRQLGFSLTYQRVAAGIWFPATYGTEFRITVFWGYKRTVTMSMENTDFRKTDAQSTVHFEAPEQ